MSSLMDILMSTFIFGILALTVGRVQTNINSSIAQNQGNVVVQSNAVELARILEYDFAKIGYKAIGQKITAADSTTITFDADLERTSAVKTVIYSVGTTSQLTATANPRDFSLKRTVSGNTVNINYGIIAFNLKYYDIDNAMIPTPIASATDLNKIHSIKIHFDLQSPEPIYSKSDTTWEGVSWEKTIIPRNLSNLNY